MKNEELRKEIKRLKLINQSLTNQLNYLRNNQEKIIQAKVNEAVDKVTRQFEDKVISLEKQVSNLKSILNNDASNSGIPTSQTPISKKKEYPIQERKATDKKAIQNTVWKCLMMTKSMISKIIALKNVHNVIHL